MKWEGRDEVGGERRIKLSFSSAFMVFHIFMAS